MEQGYISLYIDTQDEPIPVNYEAEAKTLRCLLSLPDSSWFNVSNPTLKECGSLTSWIAWQLGCVAEALIVSDEHERAMAIAAISIKAAIEVRDITRLCANLLTLAGIHIRLGHIDAAESYYRQILELPFSVRESERALAHASLASILSHKREIKEATYHFEKAIPHLKSSLTPEAYKQVLKQLLLLYGEIEDLAGLAYGCAQLGLADSAAILKEEITPSMHVESALSLVSRLHFLGEHALATLVYNLWKHGKTPWANS